MNFRFNLGFEGGQRWIIKNAKKINIFIGPNNSGKSRLIRRIATEKTSAIFDLEDVSIKKVHDYLELNRIDGRYNLPTAPGTMQHHKLSQFLQAKHDKPYELQSFISDMFSAYTGATKFNLSDLYENFIYAIKKSFGEDVDHTQAMSISQKINNPSNYKIIYIPILRGLRAINPNADIFKERTVNDYFEGNTQKNVDIFTGLDLYKDLRKKLLGHHDDRVLVRKYEKFLSANFFSGREITLTPMIEKDVIYIKEGDKQDYPIYNLGDGIQSIIILTYKLFTTKEPAIFLIEEPEQNLHAGLQRKFIETLIQHESENLFFITTHSNHFLDSAQEYDGISIQRVMVSDDDPIPIAEPQDEYSNILADLGVRASSVLLANCSIWVEGVTDKLYLRAFLKKYISVISSSNAEKANSLKSFFENLHYIFVEYQGSNVTHWNFDLNEPDTDKQTQALKLNSKIMLIADSDIENKSDRVENLRSALGNKFELLPFKEIENMLPIEIIQRTAVERWKTFKRKSDCDFDDEKILTKANLFKNPKTGVGSILEIFVTNKPEGFDRNFFKDKSGTIKDKVQFCQTAVSIMENDPNWSLTPELTILCEKIWDHIISSNKTPL